MSTSCRPPFIVLGTGRCGTVSICEIVDVCKNTKLSHEEHLLPWYGAGQTSLTGKLIEEAKACQKDGITRGFSGYMYLPHLADIRSALKDLRVVVLHREKQATVDSFCNFASFMIRPKDKKKWADGSRGARAEYIRTFPLIDAATPRQSFEFWWEFYNAMTENLPEPVLHFDMLSLNIDADLDDLFDFLEIPDEDRVFAEKRQHHSWRDVQDAQGWRDKVKSHVERKLIHEQWR